MIYNPFNPWGIYAGNIFKLKSIPLTGLKKVIPRIIIYRYNVFSSHLLRAISKAFGKNFDEIHPYRFLFITERRQWDYILSAFAFGNQPQKTKMEADGDE